MSNTCSLSNCGGEQVWRVPLGPAPARPTPSPEPRHPGGGGRFVSCTLEVRHGGPRELRRVLIPPCEAPKLLCSKSCPRSFWKILRTRKKMLRTAHHSALWTQPQDPGVRLPPSCPRRHAVVLRRPSPNRSRVAEMRTEREMEIKSQRAPWTGPLAGPRPARRPPLISAPCSL